MKTIPCLVSNSMVAGSLLLCAGIAESANPASRDPTQPPVAYAAPAAALREPIDMLRAEHLVSVNGVRFLIWNSRRYAVGDTLAGARIERISETEVWLKNAAGIRKLAIFTGVEKRQTNPPADSAPVNSSKVNPPNNKTDGKKGNTK